VTGTTPWRSRIVGHGEEAPDQLLANPLNFRIHPKPQQDALAGVLSEVGWVQDVIVNQQTGHVIDGHLRVSLAIGRREPSIPVVYVDLDEAEEKLILATIDPLSAMAATDAEKLDELLREVSTGDAAVQQMLSGLAQDAGLNYGAEEPAEDPGAQIDRAAELQEKWQTARGQLWEIGRHRLLCGDSTSAEDVARLMGGERVGAVVTDPPYGMNLDTDYSSMPKTTRTYAPVAGDDHPFDARMLRAVSVGVAEQFWFGADYYARMLGDTEHEGSWLVWDKRVTENYDAGFGSAFELIWSAKPRRREILRHQWFQNHAENAAEGADRHHPTQKPVALISDLIERSTEPGQVVADYFLGSGTTMVAAEQTGRICYGMEIHPPYVAVVLERFSGMGLTPRLADG
jgi:DNA modification methylase